MYGKGKTDAKTGRRKNGRRVLKCPHGIWRKSRNQGERPIQRVNYCKCPVQVNLLEQEDSSWIISHCNLEHEGHPVGAKNFYSHSKNKKIKDEDLEDFKGLVKAKGCP